MHEFSIEQYNRIQVWLAESEKKYDFNTFNDSIWMLLWYVVFVNGIVLILAYKIFTYHHYSLSIAQFAIKSSHFVNATMFRWLVFVNQNSFFLQPDLYIVMICDMFSFRLNRFNNLN